KGRGHSELPRAHPIIVSSFVVRYVPPARSVISRSASPGRVISPFSGSSLGGAPGLRAMMDSGLSIRLTGMLRHREAAEVYGFEKFFTTGSGTVKLGGNVSRCWVIPVGTFQSAPVRGGDCGQTPFPSCRCCCRCGSGRCAGRTSVHHHLHG